MQFFKKKPFAHGFGKPRACPGDKADVHCAALPSADAGGFSAAQQAHDPHLCRQGEGFHAVEEQRAAIRQLAFAGPAAFPIESKQFAAQKAARDASAVHGDEGGLPAASRVVDGLSEAVPLRPFLTREQDRSVMPRGAAERLPCLGNGGGIVRNIVKRVDRPGPDGASRKPAQAARFAQGQHAALAHTERREGEHARERAVRGMQQGFPILKGIVFVKDVAAHCFGKHRVPQVEMGRQRLQPEHG